MLLAWWFIQGQWVITMKLLTPWEPGSQLLTSLDIKLGRLASSIKNKSCTDIEIKNACQTADLLISNMMRQDRNENRRMRRTQNKKRNDKYPR